MQPHARDIWRAYIENKRQVFIFFEEALVSCEVEFDHVILLQVTRPCSAAFKPDSQSLADVWHETQPHKVRGLGAQAHNSRANRLLGCHLQDRIVPLCGVDRPVSLEDALHGVDER
eukprot:3029184-Rhodomonas_salina.4